MVCMLELQASVIVLEERRGCIGLSIGGAERKWTAAKKFDFFVHVPSSTASTHSSHGLYVQFSVGTGAQCGRRSCLLLPLWRSKIWRL